MSIPAETITFPLSSARTAPRFMQSTLVWKCSRFTRQREHAADSATGHLIRSRIAAGPRVR